MIKFNKHYSSDQINLKLLELKSCLYYYTSEGIDEERRKSMIMKTFLIIIRQ